MAVTGIIAEFNPLHIGHKRLIDSVKQKGDLCVVILSGNFVQRGDVALLSKQKRAEAALRCGADLVAELPVYWSLSTAQNFALGGVAQAAALGCERLLFGSETGDIAALKRAASVLESDALHQPLAALLAEGLPFAAAREQAARQCGLHGDMLKNPNDILGIEYIMAAHRLGVEMDFDCIQRIGSAHDSLEINPNIVSSALLRQALTAGNIGFAEKFMPPCMRGKILPGQLADLTRLAPAVLAVLRLKSQADFMQLPDLSEGLENKLLFAVRHSVTLDGLFAAVKSKRYSMARIRRLILAAFLGLDNRFFGQRPPYVRVLGISPDGEKLLQKSKKCDIPIVTRATDIAPLGESAAAVFAAECRAGDLYTLALANPQECGLEYKAKFLKTECLP